MLFRSGLALYQAHLGRKQIAERAMARAISLSPKNSELLFTSALVYELVGLRSQALKAVDKAYKAGYSFAEIEREPELKRLRLDPRFQNWHRHALAQKQAEPSAA